LDFAKQHNKKVYLAREYEEHNLRANQISIRRNWVLKNSAQPFSFWGCEIRRSLVDLKRSGLLRLLRLENIQFSSVKLKGLSECQH